MIKILLNAEPLEVDADYAPKKGTLAAHSEIGDLFLPLEGVIDIGAEKARLGKELEKIDAEILKVAQKLNNPAFTQKVPDRRAGRAPKTSCRLARKKTTCGSGVKSAGRVMSPIPGHL